MVIMAFAAHKRWSHDYFKFKIVVLGESGVGKSSIIKRFVTGEYTGRHEITIGAAFSTQTVCLDDDTVKFHIWDTAGQEKYHSLAPIYYRGAHAAIVVYDITDQHTFERTKAWVRELQHHQGARTVIALAGNKADLACRRDVPLSEAKAFADENRFHFLETSAKSAFNVNELFTTLAKTLATTELHTRERNDSERVRVSPETESKKSEGRCGCGK